ncbi:hypothetical protein MPTK1_2g08800 [Marchantia polymorpha subsp. ruderalis]|uniref:Uncharacterized protein n=1 Tax=Marchantia polymorpha TaxID=3197 RepID=A0A2R6XGY3_MARPO|nr:hypothetical protein MARPO_0015s0165 [Marchantia polymorpha]BBN01610.1 hypothetical protein Mp_2g08800 [Marchantia polymorpha subsp. ruderalis]|eukprot:PTQ45377.1 hypothetical protein MARPO_0015s0165 [Marchantia polymorpha]
MDGSCRKGRQAMLKTGKRMPCECTFKLPLLQRGSCAIPKEAPVDFGHLVPIRASPTLGTDNHPRRIRVIRITRILRRMFMIYC